MIDKLERELLRLKEEKKLAEAWEEIDDDVCPICGCQESGCEEVGCMSDDWEGDPPTTCQGLRDADDWEDAE